MNIKNSNNIIYSIRQARQAGFTIIEIAVALAIVGVLTSAVMAPNIQDWYQSQKNSVAAAQIKTIGDAASRYIQDNYTSLTSVATATRPVVVTVPMLQSSGYLQSNVNKRNNLNQAMCVLVKQPAAGKLQALLVTEGGEALNDIDLPAQASLLGGAGGYVSSANTTTIQGVGGGWTLPVSTFDNLNNDLGQRCDGTAGQVRVQPGHSVMALWFTSEDKTAGVLYRNAIPGKPELNRMNTAIDMNSQNINNANTVQAVTGNIQTISSTTGNIQAINSTTGNIRTINSTTGNIQTINASNANMSNANISYLGGLLRLNSIAVKGRACSPNGRLGRDYSGKLLSCQNGRWNTSGGGLNNGNIVSVSNEFRTRGKGNVDRDNWDIVCYLYNDVRTVFKDSSGRIVLSTPWTMWESIALSFVSIKGMTVRKARRICNYYYNHTTPPYTTY